MIDIDMNLFHFLRPGWLYGLLPLLLICLWLWRLHNQRSAWRKIVSPALLPHLLVEQDHQQSRWPLFLVFLTGTLALLAMAGPTWERLPQPVFRNDAALVIALDLSRSMDAQDIKPSRIQRAHFKLTDIIRARTEGQTALIVYAADAFTVTPLTDDGQTIISQLGALTPDLMPAQGSQAERALELASKLLRQAGQTQGDILLITDEVKLASGIESAKAVRQQGYRLSILGVGTEAGAPIPRHGSMLKDTDGAIVIARLNADQLRKIATAGGGRYASISTDDSDLARLAVTDVSRLDNNRSKSDDLTAETWKEFGPWLLLPVLLFVSLAFRRGVLILALVFLLPLPQPAQATEWSTFWKNLWQTPDQQAQALMRQQQPGAAADKFSDPAWKGSAQYKAGNYQQALENYKSLKGARARYNEGNSLAKLGKLKDAIEAYDKALRLDPDDEDAIYNRKLVEDALKKQQQSKKQDDQKQDKQDQDKKDQQDEQQDAGNQSKQDENKSSQNQSDNEKPAQQKSDENKADKGQPRQNQSKPDQPEQNQPDKDKPEEKEPADSSADPAERKENNEKPANLDDNPAQAKARALDAEERQAREQWLNRIPDDPAGLLKLKFKYQYNQRARKYSGDQTW